jgi:hypothetical protein
MTDDLRAVASSSMVRLPSCGHVWFQPGCSICKGLQHIADDESEKPYYQCKHNLRCKKCNGYWPDKCRCPKPNDEMTSHTPNLKTP